MAQLTWKSIDAPNFSGSNELVKLSAALMDKAFEAGKRTIDDWQEGQTRISGAQLMRDAIQEQDPAALREKLRNGTFLAGRDPTYLDPKALAFVNDQQANLLRTEGLGLGNRLTEAQTTGVNLRNSYDSRTMEDRVAQEGIQTDKAREDLRHVQVFNPLQETQQSQANTLAARTQDSDVRIRENLAESGAQKLIDDRLKASQLAAKPAWEARKQEIFALENGTDADKARARALATDGRTLALAQAAGEDVGTLSSPTAIRDRVQASLQTEEGFRTAIGKRQDFANSQGARALYDQVRGAASKEAALAIVQNTAGLPAETATNITDWINKNPDIWAPKGSTKDTDVEPGGGDSLVLPEGRSSLRAAAIRPSQVGAPASTPNDAATQGAMAVLAGRDPGTVQGAPAGAFVPTPGRPGARSPNVDAILATRVGGSGANASEDDLAKSLLRNKEGFISGAKWDVNAYRVGYGSDTVTKADGSIVKVTANTQVTREDAERDLTRRSREFASAARTSVGAENWDRLSAPARAALTSVAYNYGSLPNSVQQAVVRGDVDGIAASVAALQNQNNGVNRERRLAEASMISTGAAGALPEPRTRLASSARPSTSVAAPPPSPGLAPEEAQVPASTLVARGAPQAAAAAMPTPAPRDELRVAATGVQEIVDSGRQIRRDIQTTRDMVSADAMDPTQGYAAYLNGDRPLKGKGPIEVATALAKTAGEGKQGPTFDDIAAGIEKIQGDYPGLSADEAGFIFMGSAVRRDRNAGWPWPWGNDFGYVPDDGKVKAILGEKEKSASDRQKLTVSAMRSQRAVQKDVDNLEAAQKSADEAIADLRTKQARAERGFPVDVEAARKEAAKKLLRAEAIRKKVDLSGRGSANSDRTRD